MSDSPTASATARPLSDRPTAPATARPAPSTDESAASTQHSTGDGWWVYVLRCADDSLYTGVTKDRDARLVEHNAGRGAKYTRSRLPVELVYAEPARDRSSAQQREHEIKQLPRERKIELIGT